MLTVADCSQQSEQADRSALHRVALRRAEFATPEQQALLRMALSGQHRLLDLAVLRGVSVATISREVRRTLTRLYDPIVVALIEHGQSLAPELRQLGIEHFLHGRSIRNLAELHQITFHRARAMLHTVRTWARTPR